MKSLSEIKAALKKHGAHLFTDVIVGNLGVSTLPKVNNGKEYVSGYYQAKRGNASQEKAAFAKRNSATKALRAQGFQTWTEPKSHMGGTDTCEFYFSAMRKK